VAITWSVLAGLIAAAALLLATWRVPILISRRLGFATPDVFRLDMPWRYRPTGHHRDGELPTVQEILESCGGVEQRRLVAFSHIVLDGVFPIAYAYLLLSLAAFAWGRLLFDPSDPRVLFPLFALLADWTENTGIATMALRFPAQAQVLPRVTWTASWLKWILIAVSLIVTAEGFGVRHGVVPYHFLSDRLADWRDFYTVAATVAAAVLGLFFVALSVRPRDVEGDVVLRHMARTTVLSTVLTLVIALFALFPGLSTTGFATVFTLLSVAYYSITTYHIGGFASPIPAAGRKWTLRRLLISLATGIVGLAGAGAAVAAPTLGLALMNASVIAILCLWAFGVWSIVFPPDWLRPAKSRERNRQTTAQ
jgi:hypothetical protein